MQTEIWTIVEGFPGYEVSSLGRVRSLDRVVLDKRGRALRLKGRTLAQHPDRDGYRCVSLCRNGAPETRKVHRLVASAFIAESTNPDATQVNHKSGIKDDNAVGNLEWVTSVENIQHAITTGLSKPVNGEHHGKAKLTDADVIVIRKAADGGETRASIARRFGVAAPHVSNIVNCKVRTRESINACI